MGIVRLVCAMATLLASRVCLRWLLYDTQWLALCPSALLDRILMPAAWVVLAAKVVEMVWRSAIAWHLRAVLQCGDEGGRGDVPERTVVLEPLAPLEPMETLEALEELEAHEAFETIEQQLASDEQASRAPRVRLRKRPRSWHSAASSAAAARTASTERLNRTRVGNTAAAPSAPVRPGDTTVISPAPVVEFILPTRTPNHAVTETHSEIGDDDDLYVDSDLCFGLYDENNFATDSNRMVRGSKSGDVLNTGREITLDSEPEGTSGYKLEPSFSEEYSKIVKKTYLDGTSKQINTHEFENGKEIAVSREVGDTLPWIVPDPTSAVEFLANGGSTPGAESVFEVSATYSSGIAGVPQGAVIENAAVFVTSSMQQQADTASEPASLEDP